eukprot:6212983-Pleurochrysis_carterae.AAC.4
MSPITCARRREMAALYPRRRCDKPRRRRLQLRLRTQGRTLLPAHAKHCSPVKEGADAEGGRSQASD